MYLRCLMSKKISNLVLEVRDALLNVGMDPTDLDRYDNDGILQSIAVMDITKQQHSLNMYWYNQLATIDADTTNERFSLVSTGMVADWLRLFKVNVAPAVIKYRLPINI